MTICIAAICNFSFGKKENGTNDETMAVISASDRMFTDLSLGIEYETGQGKFSPVGRRAVVLVSDSLPIHSELLAEMRPQVADNLDIPAREVAEIYSELIIARRRKNAEKIYLARYGLTMETFIEASKGQAASTVLHDLAQNILDYKEEVNAIVAGVSPEGEAFLFSVDADGIVLSHADIGFVAIGIGHQHANAYLMARKYWNKWNYYAALPAVFAAKKEAEMAPGVGSETDMSLITREGLEVIIPFNMAALNKEYPRYKKELEQLENRSLRRVWKAVAAGPSSRGARNPALEPPEPAKAADPPSASG